MQKSFKNILLLLIFTIIMIPLVNGIYIVKSVTNDEGIWENIEYGEYSGQEPDGSGLFYLSANCSISSEASYITKDINLEGLNLATIEFSYYYGGYGTAIVGIYSGGYGMDFWEETIFFFTSGASPRSDNFESEIYPSMYSSPDEVYLEFYYFNDYGPLFPGFSIDDISIAEIGYFNSFEVFNGSLSGYVNDTSMNPICGAKVRVSFHSTYEEDYTDSSGFYHVTNIPMCWCLKNCTASKEGYSTEEVWLSIGENTTHDFELSCVSFHVNANGPYFSQDCGSIQFHGSAYCGSEPYSWHWDFGDGNTSTLQNPYHTYVKSDIYTVILSVTDNDENTEFNITFAVINHYIWSPTISGLNQGKTGIKYEYEFLALHPDGDHISYYINWDDGTITDWTAFQPPGHPHKQYHIWTSEGVYNIRAKAKVPFGCESAWNQFEIKISNPRSRPFLDFVWLRNLEIFPILQRILGFIR